MLRRSLGCFAAVLLLATLLLLVHPGRATAQERVKAHESRLTASIVAQLNRIRLAHGLQPLSLASSLSQAAAQHTDEMGHMGYFAHASADHSAFWLRIRRWYPASGFRFWSVGENLLWRSPNVTAAEALRMWMASPEHRFNILNPRWHQLGIAVEHFAAAPGTYANRPVTIITTDFGVRQG